MTGSDGAKWAEAMTNANRMTLVSAPKKDMKELKQRGRRMTLMTHDPVAN